jgi:parvulin-like peptidyl-prolyl isomerase
MTRSRLVLPLLSLLLVPSALGAEMLNRIVLRVNDQIATLYDYEQRRSNMAREILRQQDVDEEERRGLLADVGELAYKDLYEELLVESRAGQLGIEVADAQIAEQLAQMKQNFGIQTDEDFAAALAQSGLTAEQLRERLRRDLRAREVMGREVQSRVKVDEDDLRRIYQRDRDQFRQPEQVQLREVVVLEEGGLPTAGERARLAAEIRQTVSGGSGGSGGKSLADAVAEPAKKGQTSNVIDIGWVAPGDLDPTLESAVWKLAPGSLSEPVAARGGLHLVQLVERRESRIPPFSEVQEQIRTREQRRKMQEEVSRYMAELEKKSLIVTEPPPGAENFRRLLGTRPASEDEMLGLTAPVQTTPPVGGEPGALPEAKPVTNTPPPVVQEPPNATAPPPPPGQR